MDTTLVLIFHIYILALMIVGAMLITLAWIALAKAPDRRPQAETPESAR